MDVSKYLLGYRILSCEEKESRRLLNRLIESGVGAEQTASGFAVSLPSYRRARRALDGSVVYSASEIFGLPAVFLRYLRRFGIHLGVLVSLLCLLFLRSRVLDVRVEGNETVSDHVILEELERVGLYPGVSWSSLDTARMEASLLETSSHVGWINVNRRGLVAYVTVKEKEVHEEPTQDGYRNLVSAYDAVIEEIVLRRGAPCVEVGQTVSRGQLLLSGILEDGTLTYADGEVRGRVHDTVEIFVGRLCAPAVSKEERLVSLKFDFFGKSINIFKKNTSNLPEGCVIIEDNRKCTLFGGRTLPISLVREYALVETSVPYLYTDEELVALATRLHARALLERTARAELLSITTTSTFVDGGYKMVSEISYLTELSLPVPLSAD